MTESADPRMRETLRLIYEILMEDADEKPEEKPDPEPEETKDVE